METGAAEEATKLLSYGLIVMFVTHALTHVAESIRDTLFPVLKEEFSLTNQQIGMIVTVPLLCQALFSVPAGLLSDRLGARRLMTISICLAAAGALVAGMTQNPLMYIIATTLMTLNSTIYHPPAHSYTSSLAKPRGRAKALGILNAGGTLGFSIGPLSVTFLMGVLAFGWRTMYLFWVLPILLGLVTLYSIKSEHTTDEAVEGIADGSFQSLTLLSSNMIFFLVSIGIRGFAGGMTSAFLSIYLAESRGWSLASVGLMFGVSSLMGLVASPLGGIMASRFGEKKWLVVCLGASYTCFLSAFLVYGMIPFVMFYLSHRFFDILGMAADASITARLSPNGQRGIGFALSFLPGSLVGAVAPMTAAFIADSLGLFPIFMASTAVFFIGLGVVQFGVRID